MRILILICHLSYYAVASKVFVVHKSCPPGCKCYQDNSIVACPKANLKIVPVVKFANNVKRLILRGNSIERVNPKRLKRYKNLEYLDLSENKITILPSKVFKHNPLLREIKISSNPFRCDCGQKGFIERMKMYEDRGRLILKDSQHTKCATPQAFVGKPIMFISYQKPRSDAPDGTMFIGGDWNRGIIICGGKNGTITKKRRYRVFRRLGSRYGQRRVVPKVKNTSLVIASITAAVLVSFVCIASATKHLKKNNRWRTWLHRPNFKKKKPPKQRPSTLEEHLKLQRRASCGYPPSESSSDEESSNKAGKRKRPHKVDLL